MLPRRSLLVVIAITLVSAGCGARGPLDQSEPDAVERSAVTAAALEQLSLEGALLDDVPNVQVLRAVVTTSAPVPRPLANMLRAWGAAVPASCMTVESSTDADADGIPAAANVLFGCTSTAFDVAGAGFVVDDDDNDAASGFAVGLTGVRVGEHATAAVDARSHALDGSFRLDVQPDVTVANLDVSVAVTGASSGDPLSNVTLHSAGTSTYTPDADLGGAMRSQRGTVTSNVQTTVTERGVARTWTRQAAPSLHWNLSCKTSASAMPGFDGGAAVFTDDRGNVLRIEPTSCTTWTVTLNGVGY